MLARDISNYDGDLTADQVRSWDVEHIAVRASHERQGMIDLARRQLQVCRDAGCSVSMYTWAYFTENAIDAAHTHLALYGDEGIPIWWVDCEDTQYVGSPTHNSSWLTSYLQTMAEQGARCGIYSGRWWWVPYMGNTADFSAYPLWCAEYDGVPDLAVWTPYGAWTALAGKQYRGSPHDLDIFDESVVIAGEDMGQVTDLQNELAYLQGDVADAFEAAITTLEQTPRLPQKARDAVTGGLRPALATLRRGGPPEDGG